MNNENIEGCEGMRKKKKRKKYRLNARFYCWILGLFIIVALVINVKMTLELKTIPNFHGWSADEAMKYDESHETISIIYELAYSYDVVQNCVMEQSIKPRTKIGDDPLILTLKVSKGLPIMENFVGKSFSELQEFATLYELKLEPEEATGVIMEQSVLAGELLTKGMNISVTLANTVSEEEVEKESQESNTTEVNEESKMNGMDEVGEITEGAEIIE